MRNFVIAVALAVVASTGAVAKKAPELTPMELQALQSKEFETSKQVLFASVVSVFQDLGYQIENASYEAGLITASSAAGTKTNFWEAMGGIRSSGNTRGTAFVETMANGSSRVRLNFLSTKVMTFGYGQQARNDKPVLDPLVYRAAWEKIDEAIFVRQGTEGGPRKEPDRPSNLAAPAAGATSSTSSVQSPPTPK